MMDSFLERALLGIAHALFINRLHVLRLTEVVRLGIRPSKIDGDMTLPRELDEQLREQAIAYVVSVMPQELSAALNKASVEWLTPA